MDPYAIINLNSTMFKTQVAKGGGKTPRWEQQFEITPDTSSDTIDVKIMDEGFGGSDPVGCC